jgi:Dolichyl-phosphate-mannose-protein mannosyltransferase
MVQRDLRQFLPSAIISLLLATVATVLGGSRRTHFVMPFESLRSVGGTRAPMFLAGFLALSVGTGTAVLSGYLFGHAPNVQDATVYLFQAKVLALGRLSVPVPPMPSFYYQEFVLVHHGQWFGKYPPGWPLLLAAGVLLHLPWLVNPVIAALDILVLFAIGTEIYSRGVAILACMLVATSPFFLVLAATYLAHTATLLYVSGAAYLLIRWYKRPQSNRSWQLPATGFLFGMALATRELDAVAIAVPFLALVLRQPRAVLRLVAGALLPIVSLLAYDRVLTDRVFGDPYTMWWSFDRVGFGAHIGGPEQSLRGFTPAQGILNMGSDLQMLQAHLFGWPFYFALALPMIPFILGRANRWDLLLAASTVSVMLAYILYFNPGLFYGPRYYYVGIGWLALLAARGFEELYRLPGRLVWRKGSGRLPSLLFPGLLAISLLAYDCVVYLPAQLSAYRSGNAPTVDTVQTMQGIHLKHALVFVPGSPSGWSTYSMLFNLNSPMVNGNTVYVRDQGKHDKALMLLYPKRIAYRPNGTRLQRITPP